LLDVRSVLWLSIFLDGWIIWKMHRFFLVNSPEMDPSRDDFGRQNPKETPRPTPFDG
jgi:hypothetical protein